MNNIIDELTTFYYNTRDTAGEDFRDFYFDFDTFLWSIFVGDILASEKEVLGDYEFIESNFDLLTENEGCAYGIMRWRGNYYRAEWMYYSNYGHAVSGLVDTVKQVYPKTKMVEVISYE